MTEPYYIIVRARDVIPRSKIRDPTDEFDADTLRRFVYDHADMSMEHGNLYSSRSTRHRVGRWLSSFVLPDGLYLTGVVTSEMAKFLLEKQYLRDVSLTVNTTLFQHPMYPGKLFNGHSLIDSSLVHEGRMGNTPILAFFKQSDLQTFYERYNLAVSAVLSMAEEQKDESAPPPVQAVTPVQDAPKEENVLGFSPEVLKSNPEIMKFLLSQEAAHKTLREKLKEVEEKYNMTAKERDDLKKKLEGTGSMGVNGKMLFQKMLADMFKDQEHLTGAPIEKDTEKASKQLQEAMDNQPELAKTVLPFLTVSAQAWSRAARKQAMDRKEYEASVRAAQLQQLQQMVKERTGFAQVKQEVPTKRAREEPKHTVAEWAASFGPVEFM